MNYSNGQNGQYGQNGQNGQYGQSASTNQGWLSALGKSVSDAVKSVIPTSNQSNPASSNIGDNPTMSRPPSNPNQTFHSRLRSRQLARQGGRKTKKRGGTVNPNVSLTNLASSAYPIEGINSAQPQVYVGGLNRSRSRQAMFAGYKKGSKSKSRKGDKDFTTKRGDKVFHIKKHDVKKSRKPFSKSRMMAGYKKGTKSKTRKNDMDFTTKKGDKVYDRKKHYVRKSSNPFTKTLKNMLLM